MRVHRVRLTPLSEGSHTLAGAEARHLIQVLRVKPGAAVRAFDGAGLEAEGTVTEVADGRLTLNLNAPLPSQAEAALRLTLAFGLLKGDKMASVVRQATELGVETFQLFTSRYGDVPKLSPNKLERLRRVAQEAAKQCGRSVVPEVAEPVPLDALELKPQSLVADPDAKTTLSAFLKTQPKPESLHILTGPEGGFHPEEVAMLASKGATAIYLGARLLRAETAPVAFAAALLVPEAL